MTTSLIKLTIAGNYYSLLFLILAIINIRMLCAYETAEHLDIGSKAKCLYIAYVTENQDTSVGKNAISKNLNWQWFSWALEHEDDTWPTPLYMRHFFNPITGKGLSFGGEQYDSAVVRAQALWNDALADYMLGDYVSSYTNLGRVSHLVMDMGVPAHVNDDPHGFPGKPGNDYYEHTYIHVHQLPAPSLFNSSPASVADTMVALATVSHRYDSDDMPGILYNGHMAEDGFSDLECMEIASACYRGAVSSVSSILKLFYDEVKPTVKGLRPTSGQIHSGLTGVPLEAKAHAYLETFENHTQIDHVDFLYAEPDNPATTDWKLAGIGTTEAGDKYSYNWRNEIDDNKVWVRAVAVDKGNCDSIPDAVWIMLDQTRPIVTRHYPEGETP